MKKIISKMLILLFLLNLIAPFSVFAANDITIYNCEKIVTLDYGIEQFYDKNYIYEKDIENINLYITSKSIITSVGNVDMKLYPGSSIVVVNGTSITYPNATVETDDGLYISIELLAMFFSEIYEVSDTVIKLWISDTGYDFARGIISLPSDEVAPTGGIEIEVFVAEKPTTTLSSGITIADSNYELAQIGTPGYSKNEKPMYDDGSKTYNAFLDYEKKVSDVVVIPEGKNNVEYTLSIQCDDFEKCIVAYYTEIEGNPFYGKLNYAGTDILYNFTLSNSKPTINGMISIPTNAKSDVKFRVIAHGKSYNYIYDGVISMGEKTAQYSVAVDKNSTYSVELIFIDSEYSRVLSDEKIYVGTDSIYGMNLATEVANKYIANISLPDDYNEDINNIYLEVYLQMATSPYYVLDVQSVSLNQYTRNASVVLYDDIESKNVICYYVLLNNHSGLFNFGHYSKNGTSFDIGNADKITIDNNSIDMTLLKAKEISANFSLPDNDVAAEDIKIDAYPITVTYPIKYSNVEVVTPPSSDEDGDEVYEIKYPIASDDDIISVTPTIGSGSITLMSTLSSVSTGASSSNISVSGSASQPALGVAKPTIIAEGENSGNKIISIPDEDDYGYLIEFNVNGGSEKYYSKIYYNDDKTTTIRANAMEISNQTDSINVELIRQFYISGCVNAVGYENSHNRITAAAQTSDTIINDIYNCDFSVYTEIYGSGNYGLYVPEEFNKYILRLMSFNSGRAIYYKTSECVDELKKAEILSITENASDVNFSYSGYNPSIPIVLKITEENSETDEWNITLKNIGDFDTKNITVYIGFYNDNGALINLISEDVGTVDAKSTLESYINISSQYIQNASTVKVFAWSNLKPVADVVLIKSNFVDEAKIATAFMKVNESIVYHNGEEHMVDVQPIMYDGVLYSPVRAIAETLGWCVSWNADTQKLTLEYGQDNIMILTANEYYAIVNGDYIGLSYAPIVINDRLMLPLECITTYMGYECTQNDEMGTVAVYDNVDWKVKSANENNLITNILKDRIFSDNLTRLEVASLIVNMYEKISSEEIELLKSPFVDCDDENVIKAYSLGLLAGRSDNIFEPDAYVTRAEYIKVFHSLLTKLGIYVPFERENADEYTDVTSDDWASGYVYGLKEIGILDDIYEETLSPHGNITIREALAIMSNGYDKFIISAFCDISSDNPYILAITNVYNRGILLGYEDGTFQPDNCVTRAEVSAIIMRMDGKKPARSTDFSCEDVQSNHWASGCIEYCINKGVFSLENNLFRPNEAITISETIDAFMNYYGCSYDLEIQDKIFEAKELGMLDNIVENSDYDSPCLRDIMAQLINNTLNLE